jgi:putative peptide zinc metalloprotease protein
MVPTRWVNAGADALRFLFAPPIIAAVLAAIVIGDVWLVSHGIGTAIETTLMEPMWLLVLLGGIVVSSMFHELGHAAACRYGGARPGVIGVGLYLIWPAFYTDVTDSYRLSRAGRVRTDLGGIYFNLIFAVATFAAYAATGWEPLLVLVLFQHFEIVHQFLPVLRLDGYYVVSDLAGVPDLFNRVGPVARSIVRPGREEPALADLRPRARRIITAWLVITIPVLAANLVLLVVHLPRILTTAVASLQTQLEVLGAAVGAGAWPVAAVTVISAFLIALPIAGIAIIFTRLGRRLGGGGVRWASARPASRVPAASLGCLGLAALLGWTWF